MAQKNKDFVSEIDQFLISYDKAHPDLSPSQKKELMKYQRIALLRDQPHMAKPLLIDPWF